MVMRNRIIKEYGFKVLFYLNLIGLITLTLLPLIWMISTSLKPLEDVFVTPPQIISPNSTLQNYYDLIVLPEEKLVGFTWPFTTWYTNSILYSVVTIIVVSFIATFSAYAFARFPFPGRRLLFTFVLFMQLFPGASILIPLYNWLNTFHLVNTQLGLIIVYIANSLPMAIWLLEGYFEGVPRELEESAMVDGCSQLGAILRIVLRLSFPGLIATSIYVFGTTWNEFMFSLVLTYNDATRPLSVGLSYYRGEVLVHWGKLMAASALSTLPIIAIFIILRKYFVRGMLEGALKG